MRIIACLLVVAGVVSAQISEPAAAAAAAPAADPAPAAAADPVATAKSVSVATAPGTPAAAGAPAATAALKPVNPHVSPAFYGTAFNNPTAVPLPPVLLQEATRIVGLNPNIRFHADQFGEYYFANQFGQELEAIQDGFGRDILENFERELELKLNLQRQQRQREFQRRQQLLRAQFQNNPTDFDTPLAANHRFGAVDVAPAAAAAAPAAAVPAAATPAAATPAAGAVPLAQQIRLVI